MYNNLPDHIKNGTKGSPELKLLRHKIEQNRQTSALFDTQKWVSHLDTGLREAVRVYT
jgi:hypothetical protein